MRLAWSDYDDFGADDWLGASPACSGETFLYTAAGSELVMQQQTRHDCGSAQHVPSNCGTFGRRGDVEGLKESLGSLG